MTDTPKPHCYAVAIAFNSDGGEPGVTMTTWIAYTEAEAMGWAMQTSHRAAIRDGKTLGAFSGFAIREVTEDDLSGLLNQLRTGGKGAEVKPLQVVTNEPNTTPQGAAPLNPPNQIPGIPPSPLQGPPWGGAA